MILQRLSKSIRKQDWFAVVIEFVVVVVGIFAGLQANEWAQERQDRKQERAALERLFLEVDNAHQQLSEDVQRTLWINQTRRNAVRFSDSDDPVPDDELPLKIGINTLAFFPAVMPISVAYDELKSSGQMQLIRSAALRDQIAQFHTDLAIHDQLRRSFADGGYQFQSVYKEHVTWNYNPEATTTDILLSTFNWDTLRSDDDFIYEIIGLLRNQLVMEEGLIQLRDQAGALCETLGDIVGRSCTST
jgi:hypothetical protein